MTASGLCCDHPLIRLHCQERPDASRGPYWLACRCGAFTPYAPTPDAAWALESALSVPSARQLLPTASPSRQSAVSYSREVQQ